MYEGRCVLSLAEERLRLAAQAAARAVPADVTTTLSAERAPGVRGFRAPREL